jgi:hypothetical protein
MTDSCYGCGATPFPITTVVSHSVSESFVMDGSAMNAARPPRLLVLTCIVILLLFVGEATIRVEAGSPSVDVNLKSETAKAAEPSKCTCQVRHKVCS